MDDCDSPYNLIGEYDHVIIDGIVQNLRPQAYRHASGILTVHIC